MPRQSQFAWRFLYICNLKNSLSIIAILFLVSCAGETRTSRVIENGSDKNLKMIIYRNGTGSDTLHFSSGQSRQISISTKNSGTDDAPDCANNVDSAFTEIEGGGILTKKIENNNNWTSETDHTKNLPPEYENTCTFRITNSDIE